MLDWFLSRWKDEIRQDLMGASDAERVCETFPGDRIMDFLDLINSNIAICLLFKYGTGLVDIIADAVDAKRYKITPVQLKKLRKKMQTRKA